MACCLTAPATTRTKVGFSSVRFSGIDPKSNFKASAPICYAQAIIPYDKFENYTFEIAATSPLWPVC